LDYRSVIDPHAGSVMKIVRDVLVVLCLAFCGYAWAETQPEPAVSLPCVKSNSLCSNALQGFDSWQAVPQYVSVSGYHTSGDGGGGNFSLGPSGCADNNGTIIQDGAGNCFYRQGETNVMAFGAQCDATNIAAPGSIIAGNSILTVARTHPGWAASQQIVVTGAGSNTGGQVWSNQALVPNVTLVAGAYPGEPVSSPGGGGISPGTTILAVSTIPIQTTGTTTGTTTLENVGAPSGSVLIGARVTAADIPPGTIVAGVSGSTVTLSEAATGSNAGESVTFYGPYAMNTTGTVAKTSETVSSIGSLAGVQYGMSISGNAIQTGSTITGIGSNSVTMSLPTTGGASGESITISGNNSILMSAPATSAAANGSETISYPGGPLTSTIQSVGTFEESNERPLGTGTIQSDGVTITGVRTIFGISGISGTASVSQNMEIDDQTGNQWITSNNIASFNAAAGTIILASPVTGQSLPATDSFEVSGGYAVLAAPAVATVPSFVGVVASVASCATGCYGYQPGMTLYVADAATGSNGTELQVISSGAGGTLSNPEVFAQVSIPFLPSNGFGSSENPIPVSQSGFTTPGGGFGATFTLKYTPTGQIWYGNDDSIAINAALASAPQNSDIWLPANRACGVGYTAGTRGDGPIVLPAGNKSLRGWDWSSSTLVALAAMPPDNDPDIPEQYWGTGATSFVVARTVGEVGVGGGMRDVMVEGNQLAGYTCAIEGGENSVLTNDDCEDGAISEWLCGYPVNNFQTQIGGTVFSDIRGKTNFNNFGATQQLAAHDYLATYSCEGQTVDGASFGPAQTALFDAQDDYNLYTGIEVDPIEPFNVLYCFELSGHQTLLGNRCGSASGAGVFVGGGGATIDDMYDQWDNAVPTANTYGVLIAPHIRGSVIEGITTDSEIPAANVVYQEGMAEAPAAAII
jgi:hypothetical protein